MTYSSPPTLRIDFVSDVSCPWCAVGLGALQAALARVAPDITAELHFQPFELNPHMPAEGQDTIEHLTQKYGISAEQARANGQAIRERGAAASGTPLTRTACCTGPSCKGRRSSWRSSKRCSRPTSPMARTRLTTTCWCAWLARRV